MTIKIAPEGVAITKRFFMALDMLQMQRKIRGLLTFTDKYGLNYWNMNTLKAEPERRLLKSECLKYLVRDFGVSAEWLLAGVGPMMKDAKLVGEPNSEDEWDSTSENAQD